MAALRRITARLASHLIGIVAYSFLSPVVVGYTVLTLGVLGFALVGGGINEQGSAVQRFVENAFALGGGVWIDWVWRRDLSFEQNALRIFGAVGVLFWIGEWVWSRIRGTSPAGTAPWQRFKRLYIRLAVCTAILCTALLVAVLAIGPGRPVTVGWSVRAAVTAYAMGLVLLAFSTPPLLFWFAINQMRGPVSAFILAAVTDDPP